MITYAYAETPASPTAAQPAPFMNFIPIIGMLAIFYFFMIRPQQKKANELKAMLAALQKGDLVITSGGIYGTVVGLGDTTVELRIADNVKVKILRSAIADKISAQEAPNGKPPVQLEVK